MQWYGSEKEYNKRLSHFLFVNDYRWEPENCFLTIFTRKINGIKNLTEKFLGISFDPIWNNLEDLGSNGTTDSCLLVFFKFLLVFTTRKEYF